MGCEVGAVKLVSSKSFIERFKAVLLLWIFYVISVLCLFICALWYGSRFWCLTLSLSLSHWYPGSGVVLDCIDS